MKKNISISQNLKVINGLPLKEQISPMEVKMRNYIHSLALLTKGFTSQLWILFFRMIKFGT